MGELRFEAKDHTQICRDVFEELTFVDGSALNNQFRTPKLRTKKRQ